jgi:nitrite reductase/ring-hydroxylating ferredoxin subunit
MTQERSAIFRWWPLALSAEISAESLTARRCGEQEYVLFRDREGVVRVLNDRCAHRRAPLSMGRITPEGSLQCGYHGWCFDGATGQCVAITILDASERVPARYKVTAFPARERDGFVYVWSGAAGDANENDVPVFTAAVHGGNETGSALLAIPHDAFVGLLLDAPGLVLSFEGLVILPEPLGDPQVFNDRIETEFALAAAMPAHRTQSPLDFPYVVRVAALPTTGQAEVSVCSMDEDVLFTGVIASEPVRPTVTALRWSLRNSLSMPIAAATRGADNGARVQFKIRAQVDPEGLIALRSTAAGDLWSERSYGSNTAEAQESAAPRGLRS